MWDDQAKAGYSYDATKRIMNTYDTTEAVRAKCDYIKEKGLGGLIMWESITLIGRSLIVGSGDVPYSSDRSLLKVVHDHLLNPGPIPGPNPGPIPGPNPGPGPQETKPWDPSTFYAIGVTVTYKGHIYKCTLAHQAQEIWTPTDASALWALVA